MAKSLGSLKAPTLISEMQVEEWYFEKVAAYKNCRPKYHYDVYALIKMPKEAVTIEKQKALEYLKEFRKRNRQEASPLLYLRSSFLHAATSTQRRWSAPFSQFSQFV